MVDTASFYISGGTLGPDAQSYIERNADTRLFDGLVAGEFCYVLDARQMGKSSLMARTAGKLRESGSKVVILDLSELGQNLSVEQWYYGLLIRLGEQLDIEMELLKYWKDNSQIGPLQRWMSGLRKVALEILDENIVIFVDEIDVVRSLPFSTDEFFAGIRECYNRRTEDSALARLSFCLIGVATPADLIRDVRTTPFNIGRRIELADFTDSEASPLAKGLSSGGRDGDKLLKRILYWTGGHPYLTQRLCQAVSESADVTNAGGVDRICEALFLTKSAREADDNLAFVRNRILRGEADLAALLDLYHQVRSRRRRVKDDDANPLLDLLRLSGVVRVVEGYLWVRNRIYFRVFDRQWVLMNMPDAELRRQKAAYWAGVLRAAGVAAVILIIMGGLYREASVARKSAEFARESEKKMRLVAENESRKKEQALIIANTAKNRAQSAEVQAEKESTAKTIALAQAKQSRQQALISADREKKQRTIAERRAFSEARLRYISDMRLARESYDSNPRRTIELLEAHLPGHGDLVDFRGFEWGYLWNIILQPELVINPKEGIDSISFSPDGRRVLTHQNNVINIWDATSGKKLISLKGQTEHGHLSVSFSHDGKRVVAVGENTLLPQGNSNSKRIPPANDFEGLIIWDAITGRKLKGIKTDSVSMAHFSPNCRLVATSNQDGTTSIFDAETGRKLTSINTDRDYVLSFSPDSKRVVTASRYDGTTRIWDAASGKALVSFKGHMGTYEFASFSPDGKRIITPRDDKTARLWDTKTGEELKCFRGVLFASFSPDGNRIFTTDYDRTARIWDAITGEELISINGMSDSPLLCSFSPDGKRMIIDDGGAKKIWDTATLKQFASLRGVYSRYAEFSPDGQHIITLDFDNSARIWNVEKIKAPADLKENIYDLVFSPDGKLELLLFWSGNASLLDVHTGRALRYLEYGEIKMVTGMCRYVPRNKGEVYSSFNSTPFSANSKRVVTVRGDGTARVWDTASGKEIVSLKKYNELICSASFSPDGRRVVTAYRKNGPSIWDANTGKELIRLKWFGTGIDSASFSPDGKQVVTAGPDNTARIWDTVSGRELVSMKGHTGSVRSAVFSPDGMRVVTASSDNTAKIWDTDTGRELVSLKGDYGPLYSASFSPDGKRVLTNTGTIWDAATGREIIRITSPGCLVDSAAFSPDGGSVLIGGGRIVREFDGDVAAIDRKIAAEKRSKATSK